MPDALRRICCWLALLCACVSVVETAAVHAQQSRNTFLPAPRTLRQHLLRARAALEEERFEDAILELVPILSEPPGWDEEPSADYFLASPESARVTSSLRSQAMELIGQMPRRGLELYELQFGSDGRALLDKALETADVRLLNEVVRRHFHTRAGYEAMMLLGRLQLDRNQPMAAALAFQQVVDSPVGASLHDPEASVLSAASWYFADRQELAVDVLTKLRERFPNRRVQIGASRDARLPDADSALAWLARNFDRRTPDSLGPSQWLLHQGSADRNSPATGGLPLSTLRWRVPIAFEPDATLLSEIRAGNVAHSDVGIPTLSPLAVKDVIVMRSPDRMFAIDFATGKRIWEYPWSQTAFPPIATTRRGGTRSQEIAERKGQLYERLWLDVPYGQVSSDGESVFLIDDLRFTRRRISPTRRIPRQGIRTSWTEQDNQLVALDLAREGSLKWMVGGDTGLDEPRLAGAFFLGAPLPIDRQLFVIAELASEVRLVVLDSATGKQQWTQPLAHVDMQTLASNPRRRLAGAAPSYADGILVCPTSVGAVVAIDLASRSLLWGYQYQMVKQKRGYNNQRGNPTLTQNGWLDSAITVAEGVVVVAPPFTTDLLRIDLLTGKRLSGQRAPDIGGSRYVACVHEGKVLLVGNEAVTAVGISDGALVWDQPIEFDVAQEEAPSGRGFRSGNFYYLPTTASRLLQIDVRNGELAAEIKTDQVLGNLICYKDEVISQGSDYLTTSYQIKPLEALVNRRLEANPQDAWALARRGELQVNDGELGQAIESFREAYDLERGNVGVRELLVKTLLRALGEDFAAYEASAAELDRLIDRPAQRLEYLRLMAAGLHASDRPREASIQYFALADRVIAESAGKELNAIPVVSYDKQGTARLDRWISAQLADLFDDSSSEVQQAITAEIAKRFSTLTDQPMAAYRRQLALFGFHSDSVPVRTELAVQTAKAENWLEAELLLSEIAGNAGPSAALAAAERVIEGLASVERYQSASVFYRRARQLWAEGSPDSATASLEAAATPQALEFLTRSEWPYGKVERQQDRSGSLHNSDGIPITLRSTEGVFDRYNLQFHVRPPRPLTVQDGFGRRVASVELPDVDSGRGDGLNYAKINGNLLVSVLGDYLVAVDLFNKSSRDDEQLLWSDRFAIPLTEQEAAAANFNGSPFDPEPAAAPFGNAPSRATGDLGPVNANGVVYLKSRNVVCVDPLTGDTLWTRANPDGGSVIFGDRDYVFVAAPESDEATVFNAMDGSPLGKRAIPRDPWATHGRMVLAWEGQGENWRLHLYDAWLEKDIWTEDLARESKGRLITDGVAIMEPNGRFLLRSLKDASVMVDTNVEPEDKLKAIYVLASGDQYILVTDRARPETPFTRGSVYNAPMINGHVYAFSRATGKPVWPVPATIEDFFLPLQQPRDVPTLWFVRQFRSRSNPPSNTISAVCLDRRDGRSLFNGDVAVQRMQGGYQFRVSEDSTVSLVMQRATLRLRFTDNPIPPEPPAQITTNRD